jgi:hypothetical protein
MDGGGQPINALNDLTAPAQYSEFKLTVVVRVADTEERWSCTPIDLQYEGVSSTSGELGAH